MIQNMGLIGQVILAAVVALSYPVIVYFLDNKGLRKFPAPSVAGFTPLWVMYYSWYGTRYEAIDVAHKKLGRAVRISPNHISFSDPEAYKDIYGHGTNIIKDKFYENTAGGNPSVSDTTSRAQHAEKRKTMSHAFSSREVTALEPRLLEVARKLVRNLKYKSEGKLMAPTDAYPVVDGVFDLRPWLNFTSYDTITTMFWSKPYGFLDKGNDIVPARLESGKIVYTNAMNTFHSSTGFTVWLGHLPAFWYKLSKVVLKYTHGNRSSELFTAMARHLVIERLISMPPERDLFSSLPAQPSAKRPNPMDIQELIAESTLMLNAGNDTLQTSLTNVMWQLSTHHHIQTKLHKVLARSLPSQSQPIATYSELANIPYLRAVLDESFRCRAPVGFGLPRRTVEGGATIAGYFVPDDTTVSAPLYTIHLDESLFYKASIFIPERWLPEGGVSTEQERQNLKDY
ncbi:hypothetical protein MMC08_005654, partial [Hypocenomyce scalaris]|nr:hypothetical protein [Hypocenomyce scalaris]